MGANSKQGGMTLGLFSDIVTQRLRVVIGVSHKERKAALFGNLGQLRPMQGIFPSVSSETEHWQEQQHLSDFKR